jgi:hypothetical protein
MNRVRQRLSKVLADDDVDATTEAAVRSFWSRARALPLGCGHDAEVVDMALWAARSSARGRTPR